MKEPMLKFTVVSGSELVPNHKPYVAMSFGVQVVTETPGSPMVQVNMQRMEATLGSFGSSDLFTIDSHLWVRWSSHNGEITFCCRYYKERPGKADETVELIVKKMSKFINNLRLKEYPISHVGFPAGEYEQRYWLSYVLGVTDDCPTP